jgi:transcriptional regulator with XRE-family HTH domain
MEKKGRCGELLKELRIRSGRTLRDFCTVNGFDAGNYSRIERGLFAPPQGEKLAEYAMALGVEKGSDIYIDIFDRAAADRGELPHDLLADEQLVAELPLLFRTLRNRPITEEKMDNLVSILRKRT